jgi:biotin operon repressor
MKKGAPEERPARLYLSSVFERAKELNLAPSKRLVLVCLFRYLGDKDYCFPSQQSIAEDTGLTERTVRTLLKELAKNGVIEITTRQTTGRKHGNHTYEYRFKIPHNDNQTGNLKQNQTGNPRQPNRKSTTTKAEIHDRQTGNLRHSKVPEKQASRGRAGTESVKGIYKENKSVNQSARNDGLTDEKGKKISAKKTASGKVDPPAWNDPHSSLEAEFENFAPPPGAPPRLTSEQINAIFGGRGPQPLNLPECSKGDVDLGTLVYPFRINRKAEEKISRIIGFNPDTPKPSWFEVALKEFAEKVFNACWNWDSKPPGVPFRRRFERAGRSGLLYEFGFRPLSPEQQEERRRDLERQEEKAAGDARLREEERRRLAKKEAEFKAFIRRSVVRNYLDFMGIPPRDYKNHLREIAARLQGQATLTAVEQFMREKLQNEGY